MAFISAEWSLFMVASDADFKSLMRLITASAASLIFEADVADLIVFKPFETIPDIVFNVADRSASFCFLTTLDLEVIVSIAELATDDRLFNCGCSMELNAVSG